MGITSDFSKSEMQKRFDAFLDEIQKMQIEALQELGEMCVSHARNIPKTQGFEDQTGNLRSSIGYAVFVDGEAIHAVYDTVEPRVPTNGVAYDGAKKGEMLAKLVGSETNGLCLVVTAGMNYAVYVESKGRDVITSAEHLAERELPKMLAALTNDVKLAAE